MSEGLMTKDDSLYFTQCFNDSQRNGQITFDQFTFICSEYKKLDQAVLQETLKDLKASLDKKNNNAQINLKQDEYFNHVNTVLKDQVQSKNQNDPEMEKLFKSLAGKEGDYVYKKNYRISSELLISLLIWSNFSNLLEDRKKLILMNFVAYSKLKKLMKI